MKLLKLLIYVIFGSVFVALGFIWGCIESIGLPDDKSVIDVASSLGSVMAGTGTLLGVIIAVYVGMQWKIQHRMNLFSSYYVSLERMTNAELMSGDLEHSKIDDNYPLSFEYSDYERRRFSELALEASKAYELMSLSFSKIELQYPDEVSKSFHPKKLLLAINLFKQAISSHKPHEIDYDEYINIVKVKRKIITGEFDMCKESIKLFVKTT